MYRCIYFKYPGAVGEELEAFLSLYNAGKSRRLSRGTLNNNNNLVQLAKNQLLMWQFVGNRKAGQKSPMKMATSKFPKIQQQTYAFMGST